MQIILLDELRFDTFANSHPNYNYYQTSNYGKLMVKKGNNSYYLGYVDDVGDVKAATLIIVKNNRNDKRKMGYAPRGFLIDWNDTELVKGFTEALKDFLSKRGFTYVKLDPEVIYKEHNNDGSDSGSTNDTFVKSLQSLGYIHMGYNNGMEASKARWHAESLLDNNIVNLYNTMAESAKDKVNVAFDKGVRVYKGSTNNVNIYDMINENDKSHSSYFLDYYQFFNANPAFEIYYAKLDSVLYVEGSKRLFEEEETKNNLLNNKMQDFSITNKDQVINEKMMSDNKLAEYKNNIIESTKLFQQFPSGIVVAAVAIIKQGKRVNFINSIYKDSFKDLYPEYLLKWQLIQEFAKQGYEKIIISSLTSDLKKDEETITNVEVSNKIVEYVGEFDLVINKKSYYSGSRLNPIMSWLNTPI